MADGVGTVSSGWPTGLVRSAVDGRRGWYGQQWMADGVGTVSSGWPIGLVRSAGLVLTVVDGRRCCYGQQWLDALIRTRLFDEVQPGGNGWRAVGELFWQLACPASRHLFRQPPARPRPVNTCVSTRLCARAHKHEHACFVAGPVCSSTYYILHYFFGKMVHSDTKATFLKDQKGS